VYSSVSLWITFVKQSFFFYKKMLAGWLVGWMVKIQLRLIVETRMNCQRYHIIIF
jgi:hypothetical protein